MKLQTIKKREDFILSNKFGKKIFQNNFIIQKYCKTDRNDCNLKFGFTATKKIGNAVERNRAKRRMRALISLFLRDNILLFDQSASYVIVAKKSLIDANFCDLKVEMKICLKKLCF